MIDGKSVLGIIIARGGSKGLPRKNVLPLAGTPLVAWSVAAAHRSTLLDRTILSTDDDEIMAAARAAGCDVPVRRPAELADDHAGVDGVVLHALDALGHDPDYVVLLQASSPLRTAEDIDGAIAHCHESGAPACVSVAQSAKPIEWTFRLADGGRLDPLFEGQLTCRRQGFGSTYQPNGAVYVAKTAFFRRHRTFYAEGTVGYAMPRDRSIDIDVELDFLFAEALVARSNARQ